jgi:DNA-binding Lrp family transcriptional regulator
MTRTCTVRHNSTMVSSDFGARQAGARAGRGSHAAYPYDGCARIASCWPTSLIEEEAPVDDYGAPALNDLERAIVAHLQRDGRMPFRTLASVLGVTETTVYRHAQRMIDAGYFQVIGVVDPLRLGQGHAVLAGISCDPMAARDVAMALASRPETRFVALVTGTFDVVCELVTADRAHLTRLLIEILPAIPGVRTINTSWVVHTYLTHFIWDMPALGVHPGERHREEDLDDEPPAKPSGRSPSGEVMSPVEAAAAGDLALDHLDRQIIGLLQQNGRASYAEIADVLGLTESTARRRTLRLLTSNYVRVVAVSNPFLLGFQDVVLIWFKIDLSRLPLVAADLSRQAPVRYLSRTAGGVDLVAEALFHDHAALFAFLNGPLAAIPGIREVSISFELTLYKRGYRRFDLSRPDEGILQPEAKI